MKTTTTDTGDTTIPAPHARRPPILGQPTIEFVRSICAAEFVLSPDYPFFSTDYTSGDADAEILRLFHMERRHHGLEVSDTEIVLIMCHG